MSEPSPDVSEHPVADDPNEVENAWATEVERRRRDLREGKAVPVSGDEVRRKLRDWMPRER